MMAYGAAFFTMSENAASLNISGICANKTARLKGRAGILVALMKAE